MMTAGTLDLFAQSGGLGGAALLNVGTTAGTVAAGNDNRITGALQKANNLSEIAASGSVAQAAAQANIGLTPSKFSGRLLNTQTFTSTGTYTPTAGTAYIEVEAVGGGGASGAVSATSASQNAIAATGSPGAYAKVLYTSVPSTASVVIGSGGIGAFSSGQTGGSTTFGSILTCPGGPGSIIGAAHTPPGGSTGQGGASAPTVSGGGQIMVSAFGQQNNPAVTVSLGVGTNYVSVERTLLGNYGAAAPGQFSGQSQGNKSGFNGNNGYLIVREYS
ncbi:tail fiber repeat 2-containing protein [Yersinia enterocolitica]|nr:tail fiber repeat 2-containing protein [Yersinia enterocolitica]